jgi:hypothetical protein
VEIDLKIVATRRPDLLERTLASIFGVGLSQFAIKSVAMNLDPAMGSQDDAARCRDILRAHAPEAQILEPDTPAFGGAVKRLWSGAGDRVIFHLEDDWVALEPFDVEEVTQAFAEGYGAVTPLSAHHPWDGKDVDAIRAERRKIMGLNMGWTRTGEHQFGTSPRFIAGPLARAMAEVMDPEKDPEKQMRDSPMHDIVQSFRSRYMMTKGQTPLIEDIGRDWRDARQITKHVTAGKSTWTNADNDTIA